ncbi:hypothetical protein [Achromobacter marplatensis]|uniref:hypothetical protein n=1 Tax=Achromobacter marplatensis TaxID=470868 RepID=UPI0028E43F5C|nr:hypothetical protein [Achromobacter marplatensis]
MRHFKDTVTGQYWSLEDDVTSSSVEGGMIFFDTVGEQLSKVPLTLVPVDELPVTPELPLIPQIVSRFQGREAMWQTPHGDVSLFEAAEAVINHPDTPPMYKRAWVDLQEFRRDSEMLVAVATALGLSSADLDGLFVLAGGIKA